MADKLTAREFWDTLPHCCGYPNCDGDLVATTHSEGCPLFGRKELSEFEFATAYAVYRVAHETRELVEALRTAKEEGRIKIIKVETPPFILEE